MCLTKDEIVYSVSKHAQSRYAERIMGRDREVDVARFVNENSEKIIADVNKLVCYGEYVHTGKRIQDGKCSVYDVYLNGCWVILVDNKTANVITLYKVDLGCGDEFNTEFIQRMLEKLGEAKDELGEVSTIVAKESEMYKELLTEAESQINEYRGMIKNLEELCKGYKLVMENNSVRVSQATKAVDDVVNTLIGKREF